MALGSSVAGIENSDEEDVLLMFENLGINNEFDHAKILRGWLAAEENGELNLDRLNVSLNSSEDEEDDDSQSSEDANDDSQTDQPPTFTVEQSTEEQAYNDDSGEDVETSRFPLAHHSSRDRGAARAPSIQRQTMVFPRGKKRKNFNGPEPASKRQKQ